MRNLHKSKDYVKAPISETAEIIPQKHGTAVDGRCSCGKPSAMVWIRQLGFSMESKHWCEKCFTREKAKEGKRKEKARV